MDIDTSLGIALIATAASIFLLAALLIAIGYCAHLGASIERLVNDRDGMNFDNLQRRIGEPVIPLPNPARRK